MKLLANENIPLGMVHRLRERGHDVLAIVQTCPGVTDEVVLDLARREQPARVKVLVASFMQPTAEYRCSPNAP